MSLTGEVMGSKGGSLQTIRRRYVVDVSGSATPDEDIVAWVEANAPSSIATLVPTSITYDENTEIEDLYDVEVTYGSTAPTPTQPETGSVDFRFNFQAQGAHIYQSLGTVASYAPASETAPNFQGAVNVVYDAGVPRTEGMQIDPPPETFTLAYFPANAVVTDFYQQQLAALCGCVNAYYYRGYDAGSLMLVRCSGGIRTDEDWSIDFGFAYIPNDTDIPVGDDITVTAKDGHDLLWALYREDVNENAIIKKPKAAYVERVWRRADFDLLNLP